MTLNKKISQYSTARSATLIWLFVLTVH